MNPAIPRVGVGKALTAEDILAHLVRNFGDSVRQGERPAGPPHGVIDREHVLPILAFLRDDPVVRFDFLVDVTAVDHLILEIPEITERFAVVYQLRSLLRGHHFQVKVAVPEDDPRLPSVSHLWGAAIWGEREVHDMFGIKFVGHPDMRRLLMPENYPGFPLRKDYPLRGRGERDSFPQFRPGEQPGEETRSG